MRVYQDVWAAMHLNTTTLGYLDTSSVVDSISPIFVPRDGELCLGEQSCVAAQAEIMKFGWAEDGGGSDVAGCHLPG